MGDWAEISVKDFDRIRKAVRRVESMGEDAGAGAGRHPIFNPPPIRYRVKSVSDDYLICRTWDGVTEGTSDINIAKPYTLRRTPWHGKTITHGAVVLTYTYTGPTSRTVTKNTLSEQQVIIPFYTGTGTGFGGTEIYACMAVGGTGVVVGGNDVGFMDLNIDGRAWAKA